MSSSLVDQKPFHELDAFTAYAPDTDPELLSVMPPEPYSLLAPGIPIMPGDIKRLLSDPQRQWLPIEAGESDGSYVTPGVGIAYARVSPPEGYLLLDEASIVEPGDIVWTTASEKWGTAGEHFGSAKQSVKAITSVFTREMNQWIFFARAEKIDSTTIPIPGRHRPLYPRETIRRGDKLCYTGLSDWIQVNELALGQQVAEPALINGHARYCRPIAPNHQNWYVDAEKGKAEHLGGQQDPWPDLQTAQEKIRSAAQVSQVRPCGTIWTLRGVPLSVYDLPEPEPPPEVVAEAANVNNPQPAAEAAVEPVAAAPAKSKKSEKKKKPNVDTFERYSLEHLAEKAEMELEAFLEQAIASIPPGFRLMVAGEETKPGDFWYRTVTDDADAGLFWLPVTADVCGMDAKLSGLIFARKIAPSSQTLMWQTLLNLEATHAEMSKQLAQLRRLMPSLGGK